MLIWATIIQKERGQTNTRSQTIGLIPSQLLLVPSSNIIFLDHQATKNTKVSLNETAASGDNCVMLQFNDDINIVTLMRVEYKVLYVQISTFPPTFPADNLCTTASLPIYICITTASLPLNMHYFSAWSEMKKNFYSDNLVIMFYELNIVTQTTHLHTTQMHTISY
jgi:hypothetical protein